MDVRVMEQANAVLAIGSGEARHILERAHDAEFDGTIQWNTSTRRKVKVMISKKKKGTSKRV
jgi:hypothetical protein